ncbi:type II toxin-antitoxin system RatA family toxin [uncultured Neptuniibacter sp.]|uniref:type II toxin-antitoxin system RatA family toxin n=1 Tax=uncultured Neptuniibacter sp. TaxID=502143 RepID=UPI002627F540|nr:type II toxin-antitoxin system RatA family toxin [uncultured Neptuniibacter sp.]
MAQVDRSALVLHTAEEMFDLINDVERYPEFLPWCAKTEIVSKTADELVATLYLSKGGLKYSFTTRNQLSRPTQMTLELEEGPFSTLSGVWDFKVLSDEACKVSLNLQFEFSGKIASIAMSKVFNQVATTLVDAFVTRADQIYD